MAWTTPLTAVANTALTAAQWNLSVRDNLLATAAAKATTAGRMFVVAGANSIVEREFSGAIVETSQTTTATSYSALTTPGPSVTLTTGAGAFIAINADCQNNTANTASHASFELSGATVSAAIDQRSIRVETVANGAVAACRTTLNALTPGSNTVNMMYRVSAGTGTFQRRRLQVLGL